jgi:hypothetical protein
MAADVPCQNLVIQSLVAALLGFGLKGVDNGRIEKHGNAPFTPFDWHPTNPHDGPRHLRLGDLWDLRPVDVIIPPHLKAVCISL